MPDPDLQLLVSFFKALAHESRLRILGLLSAQQRTVGELADALALKEPTVSHHLGLLKRLGLVSVRPSGTARYYSLDLSALQRMSESVLRPETMASWAANTGADAFEHKVLSTFVVDGRMTTIPASRKKRDVVLRWLVESFESQRDYPEREVNAVIGEVHEDFATLRRELIGAGLMTRGAGVYRRTS